MERKYKLTILPLFEEELNHIVDYITYVLHNREVAHQLITDIEAAIYTSAWRLNYYLNYSELTKHNDRSSIILI